MVPALKIPKLEKKTLAVILTALVVLAAITLISLLLTKTSFFQQILRLKGPSAPKTSTIEPSERTSQEIEALLQKAKESESTISAQQDRSYASSPIILDVEVGENFVNLIIGISEGTDKIIYGLIKPGSEGQTTVSYKKKSGGFATERDFKPEAQWYKENVKPGQALQGILFLPDSPFTEGEVKLPQQEKIEIRYPQRLVFLLENE